jgi:hypothetical protein
MIEISSDYEMKLRFKSLSLINFWLSVRKEHTLLAGKAATTLLPFSTSYLCEKAFYSYTNMKTKHRDRLNTEPDLRLLLSRIPNTMRIKTSSSFTFKSSFKAPTGYNRFHIYIKLKL